MNRLLGLCLLLLVGSGTTLVSQFFPGGGLRVNTSNESINKDSDIEERDKSFSITLYPNERKLNNWAVAPITRFYYAQKGNFSFFGEGSPGVGSGKIPKYYYDSGDYYYFDEKSFDINNRISPAFSYNLTENKSSEADFEVIQGGGMYDGMADLSMDLIVKLLWKLNVFLKSDIKLQL